MKRYEYKTVDIKANEEKELNTLGGNGWKLITIHGNAFYFIRESREEE